LFNKIVKLNVLSMFFVNVANPVGGFVAPDDVKVPFEVFAQKLGLITHAGIVKVVLV
jgi:hypothetical protein